MAEHHTVAEDTPAAHPPEEPFITTQAARAAQGKLGAIVAGTTARAHEPRPTMGTYRVPDPFAPGFRYRYRRRRPLSARLARGLTAARPYLLGFLAGACSIVIVVGLFGGAS